MTRDPLEGIVYRVNTIAFTVFTFQIKKKLTLMHETLSNNKWQIITHIQDEDMRVSYQYELCLLLDRHADLAF